jgi:hypothetical protein
MNSEGEERSLVTDRIDRHVPDLWRQIVRIRGFQCLTPLCFKTLRLLCQFCFRMQETV